MNFKNLIDLSKDKMQLLKKFNTLDPQTQQEIKIVQNLVYKSYDNLIKNGYIPTININGNLYKLNILKSKISPNDKKFVGSVSPIATVDLTSKLLPIRDQGSICACVGFSSCCMKEYQEKVTDYLSPSFIYNLRSNYPQDCMTIKNALDILISSGVCYENTYPFTSLTQNSEQSNTPNIPQDAIVEAKDFKIISYAQITDINSLKNALSSFGPCLIAFPVYNFSNEIWIQNPNEQLLGGHCMTVVGYDSNSFIIRNSWGINWGNNGYTNYPFDQWGIHWEIWTCTNYSKLPLSSMTGKLTTATPIELPDTTNNTTQTKLIIFNKKYLLIIFIIIIIIIIISIIIYNYYD